jgi:hypothetical protein
MAKESDATNAIEQYERLKQLQEKRRLNWQKRVQASRREKLSATKQWMQDHPHDVPCPNSPDSAAAWRRKRGIGPVTSADRAQWERYEAAMAEKRKCLRESGHESL